MSANRLVAPSSCHYCGIGRHEHFGRWTTGVGWHTFVPPDQTLIKARMLARRAARTP